MHNFYATKMNILKNVINYAISGGFFSTEAHAEVRHMGKAKQNSLFFFIYITSSQINILCDFSFYFFK